MGQMWKDGRTPKVTCSARTTMGVPCKRPPIQGSNVCRAHGGAAPQVRAAAQTRILMSADAAAAKLIGMIHSKKVDDRTKLMAIRDLLDRANLSGTQSIAIGVEAPRSFEDWVGDAIIELDVVPDETVAAYNPPPTRDLEVLDAHVVEGDEGDEPVQNKRDRAAFHEASQAKADPRRKTRRQLELEAEEGAAFAEQAQRESHSRANKRREAFMLALDAGATREQAEEAGRRAAEGIRPDVHPPRRARQSTAQIVRD